MEVGRAGYVQTLRAVVHLVSPAPEEWNVVEQAVKPIAEEIRREERDDAARACTQPGQVQGRICGYRFCDQHRDQPAEHGGEDEEGDPFQEPAPDMGEGARGEQTLE